MWLGKQEDGVPVTLLRVGIMSSEKGGRYLNDIPQDWKREWQKLLRMICVEDSNSSSRLFGFENKAKQKVAY